MTTKKAESKKRYEIIHRPDRIQAIWFATSPEEACRVLGWRLEDCDVKELRKKQGG